MLALLTNNQSTELFLPSGETVAVPHEVVNQAQSTEEFMCALRWCLKSRLISHQEYLEARDSALREPSPAREAF